MAEQKSNPEATAAKASPNSTTHGESKSESRRKFLEIAGGSALLGGLYGLTFFEHEDTAKPKVYSQSRKSGR